MEQRNDFLLKGLLHQRKFLAKIIITEKSITESDNLKLSLVETVTNCSSVIADEAAVLLEIEDRDHFKFQHAE